MAGQGMSGVDAQRQIERTGLFVNRKKMRIGDVAVEIETALEDSAGAVLLGPAKLLDGFLRPEEGQYGGPTQAAVGGRAFFGEPTIVSRSQGPLGFGVGGIVADKKRREDHLYMDTHFIHMGETSGDVFELAVDTRR